MVAPYQHDDIMYRVEFNNAVCGIVVRGNVVVNSAPMLRVWVGQSWHKCRSWLERKGARITRSGGDDVHPSVIPSQQP